MIREKFSSRLKSLLENKNISQKEFADKLGITEASLSRYVNNLNIPNIEIVIEMAKILGVSVDYLSGNEKKLSEDEEIDILKQLLIRKGFMKKNEDLSDKELEKLMAFVAKNKDLFKDIK